MPGLGAGSGALTALLAERGAVGVPRHALMRGWEVLDDSQLFATLDDHVDPNPWPTDRDDDGGYRHHRRAAARGRHFLQVGDLTQIRKIPVSALADSLESRRQEHRDDGCRSCVGRLNL